MARTPVVRRFERMRRFVSARLDRGSAVGLRLTINAIIGSAAIWAFSGLLEEILDKEALVRWDQSVSQWFHAYAVPGGTSLFQVVTLIGSEVAYTIVALTALWLWHKRERVLLWGWLATALGGYVLQRVLKATVQRTRPPFAETALQHHSYSFPSGHAMTATICYTTLAFVVATVYDWPARRRVAAYAASTLLVLLVGFSRVYLGVHYPSDVLGGIIAGIAWVMLCHSVMHVVRHRRTSATSSRHAASRAA